MMDEQFYSIALTLISGLGLTGARRLISSVGDAKTIFEKKRELSDIIPQISKKLIDALDNPEAFRRAEEEMRFIEKNHIQCLTLQQKEYPSRLRECDDAPIVLFYRGNTDLNLLKIVSIVGTRKATPYGHALCDHFIKELSEYAPDILVVSGLAYGIDIAAHRTALKYHCNTIGVLAHGLDRIYPPQHRNTAAQMIEQGGLLTEFMTKTNPDKQNFVKRNRIVAGMSDATIVVESASKGGALITAEIAGSYHRDCFAFPGKTNDEYSSGCNNLIKMNKAALITSAEDFILSMGWKNETIKPKAIQRELFPNLTPEEQGIVDKLKEKPEGLQINALVVDTNIPVNKMSAILFELEMKGVVQAVAGGIYRIIK